MKKELKVEHYDSSEVAAKKKKMLKRVATGVGAAALVTTLGYFGLVQDKKATEPIVVNENLDTVRISVQKDLDTVPTTVQTDLDTVPMAVKKTPKKSKKAATTVNADTVPVIEFIEMETFICGGGGAWFNSVVEFLEA
jgi:hypothetical protein